MRPPAAFCSGRSETGGIHGIDILKGRGFYFGIYDCYCCGQKLVRVDKTENLRAWDVGYEYTTQLIITEWP